MIVPCLSLCFSYGSPTGNPITNPNINPRLPIGTTDQVEKEQTAIAHSTIIHLSRSLIVATRFQTYTPLGSERKITIVRPDGTKVDDLTAKAGDALDKITGLSQPGYTE